MKPNSGHGQDKQAVSDGVFETGFGEAELLPLLEVRHAALEDGQAVAGLARGQPRPLWMVPRRDVTLGMRHQAEDAACGVA